MKIGKGESIKVSTGASLWDIREIIAELVHPDYDIQEQIDCAKDFVFKKGLDGKKLLDWGEHAIIQKFKWEFKISPTVTFALFKRCMYAQGGRLSLNIFWLSKALE